jgi:membrane protein DedA with SNARE-associated domain
MRLSRFPDVNVGLALTHSQHVYHLVAAQWLDSAGVTSLFFCRFTPV